MATNQTMETHGPQSLAPGQVTDPEALTTEDVRQGSTGHGVRYVLAISTAAALIAMIAAWILIAH